MLPRYKCIISSTFPIGVRGFVRTLTNTGNSSLFPSKLERSPQPTRLLSNEDTARFHGYFPQILQDIRTLPGVQNMKDTTSWLIETIQKLVTLGDFNMAHQTLLAYKCLSIDQSDLTLAVVNGWIFEVGHRGFEIMEDMMDGREIKNGHETWHCRNKHGLAAVSDSILVMSATSLLSEKYFKSKRYYSDMVTLRTFTKHYLLYGKSLSMKIARDRQFQRYNIDFFTRVNTMMHSRQLFYGPLVASMLMTGYNDTQLIKKVEAITDRLGVMNSAKTDLFGIAHHPEKLEQDIENGTCTWKFAMTMEHAPRDDRKILLANYGSAAVEQLEKVHLVYGKQNFQKLYQAWEEEKGQEISDLVQELPDEGLQKYFSHVFTSFFCKNF